MILACAKKKTSIRQRRLLAPVSVYMTPGQQSDTSINDLEQETVSA